MFINTCIKILATFGIRMRRDCWCLDWPCMPVARHGGSEFRAGWDGKDYHIVPPTILGVAARDRDEDLHDRDGAIQ